MKLVIYFSNLKSTIMQLIKQSLIASAITVLITACGGKDNKSTEEKTDTTQNETVQATDNGSPTRLEGAWEIKRAEGAMDSLNLGTVYEFRGNKLSFGKGGFNNPGKTEVTDSTFSFQAEGNEYIFMYNYKFNGDTLVVEMQKGAGQVFHMVKQ
jgi:hypothetical protein